MPLHLRRADLSATNAEESGPSRHFAAMQNLVAIGAKRT